MTYCSYLLLVGEGKLLHTPSSSWCLAPQPPTNCKKTVLLAACLLTQHSHKNICDNWQGNFNSHQLGFVLGGCEHVQYSNYEKPACCDVAKNGWMILWTMMLCSSLVSHGNCIRWIGRILAGILAGIHAKRKTVKVQYSTMHSVGAPAGAFSRPRTEDPCRWYGGNWQLATGNPVPVIYIIGYRKSTDNEVIGWFKKDESSVTSDQTINLATSRWNRYFKFGPTAWISSSEEWGIIIGAKHTRQGSFIIVFAPPRWSSPSSTSNDSCFSWMFVDSSIYGRVVVLHKTMVSTCSRIFTSVSRTKRGKWARTLSWQIYTL